MSVRQGILAILTLGDCYGYQLRAEFDRRTASTSALNVGQIYNTLDRLHRDGLVAPSGTDREGHLFYAITDAGRAACTDWFDTPAPRSAGGRDELAIKITLAATLPDVDVQSVIRVQRAETSRRLTELTSRRVGVDGIDDRARLAARVALEASLAATQAELTWLGAVESLYATAITTGVDLTLPLDTDPVRRGRPVKYRP